MNENKSVKSLKRQLMAAIAMVLVAAIALASSTYAWFVTNNKVDATTSTISAQSNAAFMKIKYDNDGNQTATTSDLTADVATIKDTPLYPAQWSNNFDSTGKNIVTSNGVYAFETAYGTDPTSTGFNKKGDWMYVGTPDTAVTKTYAVKNTFKISSRGTNLTKLKIENAKIFTQDLDGRNDSGNTKLDNALRVLVICDNDWVLCDKNGVISDSEGRTKTNSSTDLGQFGSAGITVTAEQDTTVNMYVYYDGNDSEIYSNNLEGLKTASSKITVTFTAEPQNH